VNRLRILHQRFKRLSNEIASVVTVIKNGTIKGITTYERIIEDQKRYDDIIAEMNVIEYEGAKLVRQRICNGGGIGRQDL